MIREPVDQSVKASLIHAINPLIQQLCSLSQDLGHGAGLQFTQLYHDGAIRNLQAEGVGQAKYFTKHNFNYDVFQRDFILQRIAEQLGCAFLIHLVLMLEKYKK
jgi:hypothetical protein